jgi:hypothetical protein
MTTEDPLIVTIGSDVANRLLVTVLRRSFPSATNPWDGNELSCEATLCSSGFRGSAAGGLKAQEFAKFVGMLRPLYERLVGEAHFYTRDEWLDIRIAGDGYGHFIATCQLASSTFSVWETRLKANLSFDQTELAGILNELDRILREFPVVGLP